MSNNQSHSDIISDVFGLSNLPKAVRDSLLEEIDELVFRAVLFKIMIYMNEDDKNELFDILESAGDNFDKPYAFLKSKVGNFDGLVKEEMMRIREESLPLTKSYA
jgi:hypothetical protein